MADPSGISVTLPRAAIAILWLGAVVDPIGSMFGLRYVSIVFAIAALLFSISSGRIAFGADGTRQTLILFFSFILPIQGLALYAIHGGRGGAFTDTSYLAAGILMLFSLLYVSHKDAIFGIRALVLSTRLLTAFILFTFVASMFSQDTAVGIFTSRDVALVGVRNYAGLQFPYIYFLASPLLIFLISYDFSVIRKKFTIGALLKITLSCAALFLSGTRAHMLIAIAFVPLLYVLTITRNNFLLRNWALLVTLSVFAVVITFMDVGRSFFSTNDINNSSKLALLDGYFIIFSDIYVVLFGQGFNAHEWSNIFRSMVISIYFDSSKTELTYLEIFRVFGFVTGGAFMFVLFGFAARLRSLPREYDWVFPAFVVYLVNTAFNPYLFSINGMLPIGLFSALLVSNQRVRRRKAL